MGRALNVLVLDDDVENADSIAELFASDDHKVIVAYNGQEAIEAFSSNKVDVGFFDVMMPGKNGVESFMEIKASHPDARIYFMTGYAANELLDKARENGALGVFSKPTDPANLLDVLDNEAA
jgi:two-component system, NtrC family, response regulator HydG